MQRFSIIIPTLNEAGNILPLIRRIRLVTLRHGLEPEILFVDDGSNDGTRERILSYQGPLQVSLIRRDNERGLTGAVVAGARAVTNNWVVVMDSDLSHPPESIPSLLAPLADGSCDMIIGIRYMPGGGLPIGRCSVGSPCISQPGRKKVRGHYRTRRCATSCRWMDRYRIAIGLAFYRSKQKGEKGTALAVDETIGVTALPCWISY